MIFGALLLTKFGFCARKRQNIQTVPTNNCLEQLWIKSTKSTSGRVLSSLGTSPLLKTDLLPKFLEINSLGLYEKILSRAAVFQAAVA